ncbi:MAG: pitrilysin family protein [Desulfurivibrionaceae bacterium]|nr:pitrilysin family protein [Desulfurivibrionaceae bacterium]
MMPNTLYATELAPHLHKETLANGLTVMVKETPGTKVATVQIWVKAGAIYEEEQEAGITHLIEHMIFKGTPTRGPGELAEEIEGLGGRINAYTSFENTVYHATLSARHWQKALEVLADSVQNSLFDAAELEREKKVVLEEIGMRNDQPGTLLFQTLMENAYQVHPYRQPIIGTVESVTGFERDDIMHYMGKHYHPENMMVLVVGDVRYAEVRHTVNEVMGSMAKGDYVQPALPVEPERQEPAFFSLAADVGQSHLALAFPATSFGDPDTAVLDVISSILGQGESSRLFHELRDKQQLVYQIQCGAFTPKYPGLVQITAALSAENMEAAMEAALAELFSLKYLAVSDDELTRVKRNLEGDFVFNLERAEGQARTLGSFEFLTGDPTNTLYLDQIRSVTKEDIVAVANKYFRPEVVTGGFLVPRSAELAMDQEAFTKIIARADQRAKESVPASYLADSFLTNVHRFTLKNGLTLLVREDSNVDTVAIRAVFPGGLRSETEMTNGSFAFIAELFPKSTETLSVRDLTVQVADMAGDLAGFNGKNTFGLKGDFLSRYFAPAMTLVRDVIITPGFDPQEAEKIRPELLAQLKHQEDSLPSLAFREFNRLLFQGHPYGLNTLGAEGPLARLQVAELRNIYKEHAVPAKMVLTVAGAVKAAEVRDLVEELFGQWQGPAEVGNQLAEEELLPPAMPVNPEIFAIEKDKEQVHLIIGFLGTTLDNDDRFALEVLDNILSGQSGRLFSELRDKKSLAYSLSAFSMVGLDTGSFGIYIGTSPDKRQEAISSLWKELYLVMEQEVSEKELQRSQNVLISNYELRLQTHSQQAMEMALNETYGLGQDQGTRYIKEIEAVDQARIMAVARKYIQPEHYVMVTVGAK